MSKITDLLEKAVPIDALSPLASFAKVVCAASDRLSKDYTLGLSSGEILAAGFDLGVSAAYAQLIGNNGWVFCRHKRGKKVPKLFYPFVNACPRCMINGSFVFIPSKKPESGKIGKVTSALLGAIYNEIVMARSKGKCSVSLIGGSEDVDAILHEDEKVCFLEIKAAPLVTFPFVVDSDDLTESHGDEVGPAPDHKEVVFPEMSAIKISIYIPNGDFAIPIGVRKEGMEWPYSILEKVVLDKDLFSKYLAAWKDVYDRYRSALPKEGAFWLSNGCGQPTPRPKDWPARRYGSGYESISDYKSSVGMDRTDDIKKGIYQVLKLGTHYKEFSADGNYDVKTALISNMHAIRHYDDYLHEFSDVIWSVDANDRPYIIRKDEEEWHIPVEGVHNLYDGLIAFTKNHIRDEWLASRLKI